MPVSEQAWRPIWHMSPSQTQARCISAKSPESHPEVPAPHAVCRSTSTGSLSLPVPYKATYLSMQDAGQGTNMNSVTASLREMWTAAAFSACSVDQQPETGQRIPHTVPVTGRRPGKGRFETQTQPKQGFSNTQTITAVQTSASQLPLALPSLEHPLVEVLKTSAHTTRWV